MLDGNKLIQKHKLDDNSYGEYKVSEAKGCASY